MNYEQYLSQQEKSSCGVGFVASLKQEFSHQTLQKTLRALRCQEHRGGCSIDQLTGDGSGIMVDIPFDLLGYTHGSVAVACIFAPKNPEDRRKSLAVFESTFEFFNLKVLAYREVPVNESILGEEAAERLPYILQVVIERPDHCTTNASFDKLLYTAKQLTRTKQRQRQIPEVFFVSLSANTIVYKGLVTANVLDKFYLDLQNPDFKTRFGMFHRRFSTNTTSSWDKVQPFRMISHNGEFNTIKGNRSWAISREKAMGLFEGELIMPQGVSDSGSLNEMFEALKYRSSIPYLREVMAILMPPAKRNAFYDFWGRAMEPWDGPALVTYANGRSIGARLDRNGFRPCRWALTDDMFYLSSEAGSFHLNEAEIKRKGTLEAGTGVNVDLRNGELLFVDPSESQDNLDVQFDKRTFRFDYRDAEQEESEYLAKKFIFNYTQEDFSKLLIPMILNGKEAIGSMGDTARMAVFSDEPRSLFDYFYHNFAQVTNPPLDYLRERTVTDLTTYLGFRPNIFAKKELIPAPVAFELKSPVLSLGQMEKLFELTAVQPDSDHRLFAQEYDMTFNRDFGRVGMESKLDEICKHIKKDVKQGTSIVILSDRDASYNNPAIPSVLALGYVARYMRDSGMRLKFSIVIHSGEIRTTHQIATIIGLGATAVCPYLALEVARFEEDKKLNKLSSEEKERNLVKAYENGLLKIMSKMGISVVRSYQSSQLLTTVGLDADLITDLFRGVTPLLSGIGMEEICNDVLKNTQKSQKAQESGKVINTYQFKEHSRNKEGEKHSMTNTRSKIIHELVRKEGLNLEDMELYDAYLKAGYEDEPVNIRHLLQFKQSDVSVEVQPKEEILKTFGSGAMSFGAISAEAQRDIFEAMEVIGGRSNSGEGGENPYYYEQGITAYSKQIASGRFGVNALYLVSGNEVQIKIAQGAKPGEGGQLMGIKVGEHIAKARNSLVGVDLISPPPMHDIYSIEDLKQLIFELKQLKPHLKVNVKLVAGSGIGTIAVGVAKAGADVIHISGGDGGTGAATLSSMKHAGLPWEFGLVEVHRALLMNGLRHTVQLRTDGGLHTGKDVVMAAILGAEQFDFGKLLLIAQGCVMARVCEKNTCPTGIATHNPRFKAKYKGTTEHIVKTLQYLAEDVRRHLAYLGVASLSEVLGRTDLLQIHEAHQDLVKAKKLDLGFILDTQTAYQAAEERGEQPFFDGIDILNEQILADCQEALCTNKSLDLEYPIEVTNRAILATLNGAIALQQHHHFVQQFQKKSEKAIQPYSENLQITFRGSAGQGFGAFLVKNLNVRLLGEANDSVCKSMSGGKVVIVPPQEATFQPHENVIIGNVALYGATGGTLYVNGLAGDRFAVRNSGATAIVEGTGLHACEYMTRGKVIVLGETSENIGGGMTGGEVILFGNPKEKINSEYLALQDMNTSEKEALKALLEDYVAETNSPKAALILEGWQLLHKKFYRYRPINLIEKEKQATEKEAVLEEEVA